jgi:RimJ/RimL family protein N-acetyltransferase
MLEQIDLDYRRGETVHWGIEIDRQIAGTCGFYRGFANAVGEVGYVLRADFRGRGIMTAAMHAVLTRLGFRLAPDAATMETLRFVLPAADAARTAR